MNNGILIDTSFWIKLFNSEDKLHTQVLGYYEYFERNGYDLWISTIAISEYVAGGDLKDLPIDTLKVLTYNINHSVKGGEIAKVLFSIRKEVELSGNKRCLWNDAKMLAQAEMEKEIHLLAAVDTDFPKIIDKLTSNNFNLSIKLLDCSKPFEETTGELALL